MARRSKFKISKTRRIRHHFLRLAKHEVDDIDRFRRLVTEAHTERQKSLKRLLAKFPIDDDAFADHNSELNMISRLADELSIVALYRVVELNTARMMAHEFGSAAGSYSIDRVNSVLLANKGFVLKSIPHYRAIDELRLLNNAIKHAGVVTDRLANDFPRWHRGSRLSELDKAYERLSPRVPTYILRLAERMKLKFR